MGQRDRKSPDLHYPAALSRYGTFGGHYQVGRRENTRRPCHYLRFTLSKSLTNGKSYRAGWGKIKPVLSGNQNYKRNEGCNQRTISSYRCLGERHGKSFIIRPDGFCRRPLRAHRTRSFNTSLWTVGARWNGARGTPRSGLEAYGRPALGKAPAGTTAADLYRGGFWRAACSRNTV